MNNEKGALITTNCHLISKKKYYEYFVKSDRYLRCAGTHNVIEI